MYRKRLSLHCIQSQSYITTDSLSASPSWYQAPTWDPRPIFPILSLIIYFDSFGFVDVGRPLWREVGSVLLSFCRASPAQPFSDLSPMGLMSIVYCLYVWDSPNQEGQVPVFISPRNRVAKIYPRALGLSNSFTYYYIYIYSSYMYNTYIRPLLVQARTDYALSRVVQFATQF
jgi:hypothetical protein